MANPCSGCSSPSRADLDRDILAGAPVREVAKRYGLSTGSAHRHGEHARRLAGLPERIRPRRSLGKFASSAAAFMARANRLLVDAGVPLAGDSPTITVAVRGGTVTITGSTPEAPPT